MTSATCTAKAHEICDGGCIVLAFGAAEWRPCGCHCHGDTAEPGARFIPTD